MQTPPNIKKTSPSSNNQTNLNTILGTSLGVGGAIVLVLLIIIMVIFKKKRTKSAMNMDPNGSEMFVKNPTGPIPSVENRGY